MSDFENSIILYCSFSRMALNFFLLKQPSCKNCILKSKFVKYRQTKEDVSNAGSPDAETPSHNSYVMIVAIILFIF